MLRLGSVPSHDRVKSHYSFLIYPSVQILNYPCIGVEEQLTGSGDQLLKDLGLGGMATDPFQLSRGQMMRVAVARALAPRARVLLLDEPLSALDTETREQVRQVIFEQVRHDEAYGILVTHHSEDRPVGGMWFCLTR